MLAFIDESGDTGFEFGSGSSDYLVFAMVIFKNNSDARFIDTQISNFKKRYEKGRELKFNKCRDDVKDKFFDILLPRNFDIRAVVIAKKNFGNIIEHLPFPSSFSKTQLLYYFGLHVLLSSYSLTGSRISLDKSTNSNLRRFLKEQKGLFNERNPNSIEEYVMKDSESDNLIQLADMVAGAIARYYSSNRDNPNRWRQKLKLKKEELIEI